MPRMDGVLLIDKPAGFTSHDVVARARRILQERRVGHTGTLDPFATGVLVLLIGRGTRLAQYLSGMEKEYEAVIRLGVATDTGDLEGSTLTSPNNFSPTFDWTDQEIENALQKLRGTIAQVPPMYSAKKVGGQRLYKLARRGEQIDRPSVEVTVQIFEANRNKESFLRINDDNTADIEVRVVCAAGTYVRTLAEDFGKLLGVGAHLRKLRRTKVGDFLIKDSQTLEQLQVTAEEGLLNRVLVSPDQALSRMPFVHLSDREAQQARHGIKIPLIADSLLDEERVRMKAEGGELIGVGVYDATRQLLHPRLVFPEENTV